MIRLIFCRCDRILWYGKGLRQLQYVHIESQLSDHRPVSARFMAEVKVLCKQKLGRTCTLSKNAKVEVEELLPKSVPDSDINSHYHVVHSAIYASSPLVPVSVKSNDYSKCV